MQSPTTGLDVRGGGPRHRRVEVHGDDSTGRDVVGEVAPACPELEHVRVGRDVPREVLAQVPPHLLAVGVLRQAGLEVARLVDAG